MAHKGFYYCSRALILLVLPVVLVPYWVKLNHQDLRSDQWEDEVRGSRTKRDVVKASPPAAITLFGVSVEVDPEVGDGIEFGLDGSVTLMEDTTVNLVLFGLFTNLTKLRFAMHDFSCDVDSDMEEPPPFDIELDEEQNAQFGSVVGRVYSVELPKRVDYPRLYFCLLSDEGIWNPQGNSLGTHFYLKTPDLPTWVRILFVIFLLTLSGLFSGLSLGLMSLDKNELAILINTGTKAEKKYATKIAPVRNHGNFLLCSLLFSNVLVNASLTLMMDSLMSGVFAVASATLAIVIFGEIIPQSFCNRHGLAIGAHTLLLTKFFMLLTSPLAWPLSKLLDKLLGEEIGAFYNRERLKELLVVTEGYHGLEKEEVALISGALGMKSKCVGDVMTPLPSVFMLPLDCHLDYATLSEIEFHSYTRIPIYDKERSNVVAVLNHKQITQIDARERLPMASVLDYYPTSKDLTYVLHDAYLDKVFRNFRTGKKAHMMIVKATRPAEEPEGTPTEVTVGILTMEDVLEELLQTKILDEKDIDKLRSRKGKISVCTAPPNIKKVNKKERSTTPSNRGISIPPPLALAACQSLTTNVRAFSRTEISDTVLNRVIKATLRRATEPPAGAPDKFLYQAGVPAEGFIMIFEGSVEVLAGKEKIPFTVGPFTFFGAEFLFFGEKRVDPEVAAQKPVPKRDSTGKGFQRISTHFKRRGTIQLRRLDTVMAKGVPKPPIAFPKYAFVPDYSVRVVGETFYIEVDFRMYRAARAATQLERKYKTDRLGVTTRPSWRREVEVELTVVEKDLRLKHRGRIVCTEAEDFENEDLDMEMDAQLTTNLFLGSSSGDNARRDIHEFLSSVLKQ